MTEKIPQIKQKEEATENDFASNSIENNQITQLQFLYRILSSPTLTVLEDFLKRSNPISKKSVASCVNDFKNTYPKITILILFLDIAWRIYALLAILRIILRGFGLNLLLMEIVR